MTRISLLFVALLVSAPLAASTAVAQASSHHAGHVVVVKLLERGGSTPSFEPAKVSVQPGDTLRFLEDENMVHNVRFKDHPSTAHLGAASTGPYLTTKGQTYDLVIDSRFPVGSYTFVCDPHESMGMRGTLTVRADGSGSTP